MFDTVARRYDLLNRLLSLRLDVGWRRKMVQALALPPGGKMIDIACGTGDVLVETLRRQNGGVDADLFGLDFSENMLRLARRKLLEEGGRVPGLMLADALAPPLAGRSFDAVTIAFGIRNFSDRQTALAVFRNLLKPGGRLVILELTPPPRGPLLAAYRFYFHRILPGLGGWISQTHNAYRYLAESVSRFPEPAAFAEMIRAAGFTQTAFQPMALGIVTLFTGVAP
jgi:demethylmenaquinone methyltransferase/2-methoxy-6-polyprenyl-1,4-benzoquinol methylase